MSEPKMIALIPQGPGSVVPRQMRNMEDARGHQAQGFDVRIMNDDGSTSPLPDEAPAEPVAEPAAPAKKKKG